MLNTEEYIMCDFTYKDFHNHTTLTNGVRGQGNDYTVAGGRVLTGTRRQWPSPVPEMFYILMWVGVIQINIWVKVQGAMSLTVCTVHFIP